MINFKKLVSWLFALALFINAGIFIPQLWSVWTTKNVSGISLLTFGFFCLAQLVGTLHGIFQKDNSLIIGMGASLLTCGTLTLSVAYLRYFA